MMTSTQMTVMYRMMDRGIERLEELVEDINTYCDDSSEGLLRGWIEELQECAEVFPEFAETCELSVAYALMVLARVVCDGSEEV